MTFQEFQQLCNDAVASGQEVKSPAPIIVGDPAAVSYGAWGELHTMYVIFKAPPDNVALKSIVRSVRFSIDAINNLTVITPITTGT